MFILELNSQHIPLNATRFRLLFVCRELLSECSGHIWYVRMTLLLFPVLNDLAEMQSFVNPSCVGLENSTCQCCMGWIIHCCFFLILQMLMKGFLFVGSLVDLEKVRGKGRGTGTTVWWKAFLHIRSFHSSVLVTPPMQNALHSSLILLNPKGIRTSVGHPFGGALSGKRGFDAMREDKVTFLWMSDLTVFLPWTFLFNGTWLDLADQFFSSECSPYCSRVVLVLLHNK